MKDWFWLFDIGGTKLRVTTSDSSKRSPATIIDTPPDFVAGLEAIKNATKDLAVGNKPAKLAVVAIAGVINQTEGLLHFSPNLLNWVKKPLRDELAKILGCPVHLVNDAAAAALGEASLGAGQDHQVVAYLTLSTGIGGARVVKGQLDQTWFNTEPGKQLIDPNHPVTIESLMSGTALKKMANLAPVDIHDAKIWDDWHRNLAILINNTVAYWSPEIIVLGGSLNKSLDLLLLGHHLEPYLEIYPAEPVIVKSKLGSESGLVGAQRHILTLI